MTQPQLKHVLAPDVADLQGFRPAGEAFRIPVQAIMGPRGREGEEAFGFTICSSEWIRQHCTEPMLGLHLLIVPYYSYEEIVRFVSKIVTACAAETWQECAVKLQRLGSWEFEGYYPAS